MKQIEQISFAFSDGIFDKRTRGFIRGTFAVTVHCVVYYEVGVPPFSKAF